MPMPRYTEPLERARRGWTLVRRCSAREGATSDMSQRAPLGERATVSGGHAPRPPVDAAQYDHDAWDLRRVRGKRGKQGTTCQTTHANTHTHTHARTSTGHQPTMIPRMMNVSITTATTEMKLRRRGSANVSHRVSLGR